MSITPLKPGTYRIRSLDDKHLPPGLGGMYATDSGEGIPVKAVASRPPFAEHQIVCTIMSRSLRVIVH
jgi:hypothetical protein